MRYFAMKAPMTPDIPYAQKMVLFSVQGSW